MGAFLDVNSNLKMLKMTYLWINMDEVILGIYAIGMAYSGCYVGWKLNLQILPNIGNFVLK